MFSFSWKIWEISGSRKQRSGIKVYQYVQCEKWICLQKDISTWSNTLSRKRDVWLAEHSSPYENSPVWMNEHTFGWLFNCCSSHETTVQPILSLPFEDPSWPLKGRFVTVLRPLLLSWGSVQWPCTGPAQNSRQILFRDKMTYAVTRWMMLELHKYTKYLMLLWKENGLCFSPLIHPLYTLWILK